MTTLPIRLTPGQDLRHALESAVRAHGGKAAFVLSGIGSLTRTRLRFAGHDAPWTCDGPTEIVSLAGTVAPDGSHLHACIAQADGTVRGGHVAQGCVVRTTAEVLLVMLPGWQFTRTLDAATGFAELRVGPSGDDRPT